MSVELAEARETSQPAPPQSEPQLESALLPRRHEELRYEGRAARRDEREQLLAQAERETPGATDSISPIVRAGTGYLDDYDFSAYTVNDNGTTAVRLQFDGVEEHYDLRKALASSKDPSFLERFDALGDVKEISDIVINQKRGKLAHYHIEVIGENGKSETFTFHHPLAAPREAPGQTSAAIHNSSIQEIVPGHVFEGVSETRLNDGNWRHYLNEKQPHLAENEQIDNATVSIFQRNVDVALVTATTTRGTEQRVLFEGLGPSFSLARLVQSQLGDEGTKILQQSNGIRRMAVESSNEDRPRLLLEFAQSDGSPITLELSRPDPGDESVRASAVYSEQEIYRRAQEEWSAVLEAQRTANVANEAQPPVDPTLPPQVGPEEEASRAPVLSDEQIDTLAQRLAFHLNSQGDIAIENESEAFHTPEPEGESPEENIAGPQRQGSKWGRRVRTAVTWLAIAGLSFLGGSKSENYSAEKPSPDPIEGEKEPGTKGAPKTEKAPPAGTTAPEGDTDKASSSEPIEPTNLFRSPAHPPFLIFPLEPTSFVEKLSDGEKTPDSEVSPALQAPSSPQPSSETPLSVEPPTATPKAEASDHLEQKTPVSTTNTSDSKVTTDPRKTERGIVTPSAADREILPEFRDKETGRSLRSFSDELPVQSDQLELSGTKGEEDLRSHIIRALDYYHLFTGTPLTSTKEPSKSRTVEMFTDEKESVAPIAPRPQSRRSIDDFQDDDLR